MALVFIQNKKKRNEKTKLENLFSQIFNVRFRKGNRFRNISRKSTLDRWNNLSCSTGSGRVSLSSRSNIDFFNRSLRELILIFILCYYLLFFFLFVYEKVIY